MSALLERIENHREDDFDCDLIHLFRMIPTRSVSFSFHTDRVVAEQKRCGRYRAEVLHEAEQQILELYRDEHLCEIPQLTRTRNTPWYEETIVPLIQALERDQATRLILCVRNDGAIRDLPADSSVEVPVQVSNAGMKPRKVGSLPHFLKGLYAAAKESERLIVEAVNHKSYECALQAFTVNPFVPSLDTARRYLDKVIKTEKLELH